MTNLGKPVPNNSRSIDLDYDAIIIGAGISGLYQLYKLRKLGMHVGVLKQEPVLVVPGTGTGILGHVLIQRVIHMDFRFRTNYWRNGIGASTLLVNQRSSDTATT